MQIRGSRVWFLMLAVLFTLQCFAVGSKADAQTYTPIPDKIKPWWEDRVDNNGIHFLRAYDACYHQWQTLAAGYVGTFNGAVPTTDDNIQVCSWTGGGPYPIRARFKSFSSVAVLCGSADDHADRGDLCPRG